MIIDPVDERFESVVGICIAVITIYTWLAPFIQ